MGIFNFTSKDKNRRVRFAMISGVDGINSGIATDVTLDEENEKIVFKAPLSKQYSFMVNYDQLYGIDIVSEDEIKEKSKSVVGRAVIGGLFLGLLGAIVGGMTGLGSKEKRLQRVIL